MGQTRYTLREGEHGLLNYEFFRLYNYRYWLYKICLLDYGINNISEVLHPIGDNSFDANDHSQFELSIKSEFFFVFNHTTEALFTLLYVIDNHGIAWADMQELSTGELDDYIREYYVKTDADKSKLSEAFFPMVDNDYNGNDTEILGDNSDSKNSSIVESLDFIQEYLAKIGKMYTDKELYRDIYNHFKHGLRVSTYPASIVLDNEAEELERLSDKGLPLDENGNLSDDTFLYFSKEPADYEGEDHFDYYYISQKVKTLDYELFKRLSITNFELIEQSFKVMNAILDVEPHMIGAIGPGESLEVSVRTFGEESIDDLFENSGSYSGEISRSYFDDEIIDTYIPK